MLRCISSRSSSPPCSALRRTRWPSSRPHLRRCRPAAPSRATPPRGGCDRPQQLAAAGFERRMRSAVCAMRGHRWERPTSGGPGAVSNGAARRCSARCTWHRWRHLSPRRAEHRAGTTASRLLREGHRGCAACRLLPVQLHRSPEGSPQLGHQQPRDGPVQPPVKQGICREWEWKRSMHAV